MNIDFSQKIVISPEALFQEVSGETVILDLKSEQYFGLDEVGTRIWSLLCEGGNLQKTFNVLVEEYDVDAEQLEADMQELLANLANAGLVIIDDQKADSST